MKSIVSASSGKSYLVPLVTSLFLIWGLAPLNLLQGLEDIKSENNIHSDFKIFHIINY
jgi:hypothetical protein